MSCLEWGFFGLSMFLALTGAILVTAVYRNINIKRGKSCDWCEHFVHRYNGDEMCCLGSCMDEPVPFIRTCFSFKKKFSRSSLH